VRLPSEASGTRARAPAHLAGPDFFCVARGSDMDGRGRGFPDGCEERALHGPGRKHVHMHQPSRSELTHALSLGPHKRLTGGGRRRRPIPPALGCPITLRGAGRGGARTQRVGCLGPTGTVGCVQGWVNHMLDGVSGQGGGWAGAREGCVERGDHFGEYEVGTKDGSKPHYVFFFLDGLCPACTDNAPGPRRVPYITLIQDPLDLLHG